MATIKKYLSDSGAQTLINQLKERLRGYYSKTEADNQIASAIAEGLYPVEQRLDEVEALESEYCCELDVDEDGLVWIVNKEGERTGKGPYGPFAGGSGGGGGSSDGSSIMSGRNLTGWTTHTFARGQDVELTVSWTSTQSEVPTGDGSLLIYVGGALRGSMSVAQGIVNVNVAPYLSNGNNLVELQIFDVYGKRINFRFRYITIVDYYLTSAFDATQIFTGPIDFRYTPVGSGLKTVYFSLDGNPVGTSTVSGPGGNEQSYVFEAQGHGGHTIDCYFEVTIDGQVVKSNTLHFEITCVVEGSTSRIITSSFDKTTANQYDTLNIPYRVYDRYKDYVDVTISANGVVQQTLENVGQGEQRFTYKADTAGPLVITITSGDATKTIEMTIASSSISTEAVTTDLDLYLNAIGRSNSEAARNTWKSGNISATMTGFNYVIDGWQTDDDGVDVLRLTGDARVTVPYNIFGSDFKTTGKTIEIEFATRNVTDFSNPIISCMADNIGLSLTPQEVTFKGAQTSTNQLYKENEHVRITFVVEKQTSTSRLIMIYINGIMSRAIQYQPGERFSQLSPVGISIGSSDCDLDIYTIRVYNNDLTRSQVLNNWIADTQIGSLMIERYNHNNVYNDGRILTTTLPTDLPYMILEAEELPQFKGDKKVITGSYTDPVDPSKSFTFEGCETDVQGTSSAPYFRKNYDLKFKKGFTTESGVSDTYALRTGSIPFNRFVLKADVASSESANNTLLTMFYHDTCPYRTPEMLQDSRVRWGIEGIPIVVFWRNTNTHELEFYGKYNFNLPKRANTPLGYSGDMQSWEFQRNNSDNVKFKDDDFTSTYFDNDKQTYIPNWYQDWEARMPSDEWRDYAQLKELVSWVKSTAREQATNETFASPVTYRVNSDTTVTRFPDDSSFTSVAEVVDGNATGYFNITFTKDTPAYRLTKFRAEVDDYFERQSILFYYLFTELFLMIDSRAKNMFIGFRGGQIDKPGRAMTRKAVCEPYDMDTGLGTNNSGVLMFGYFYEDTDTVSGLISGDGAAGATAPVYNAQDSVLFNNIRDALGPELTVMFRQLRSSGGWSYNAIETRFEKHQSKWPEAIFNEDAFIKYIYPVIYPVTVDEDTGKLITTDRYLTMLQGSKTEQRKWWLYNRFKYLDSKYVAGTANTSVISMRLFNDGTITITPAIDSYVVVQFGGGTAFHIQRTTANTPVTFQYVAPSGVTEMETYIYSADTISDIGDLSRLFPNEVDFSKATKLKRLKLGDNSPSYSNPNLKTFDVSNSALLESIDVRNCPALAITVNLEGSPHLEEAYFDGTAITGVDLVDGGVVETLHLPATITSLTLMNQNKLTDLSIAGYSNISRLMLANIDQSIVDPVDILERIQPNSQVYISGLDMTLETAQDIEDFLALLDTMKGVTREKSNSGVWLYHEFPKAQVSGTIHTSSLTGEQIEQYNDPDNGYPYLIIDAEYITSTLTYKNYDGSETLKTVTCKKGPGDDYAIPQESAPSGPERASTAQYSYSFVGWSRDMDAYSAQSDATSNITGNRTVYAAYTRTTRSYTVTWKNKDNSTIKTETIQYGNYATYSGTTPTYQGQTAIGWTPDPAQTMITGNTEFVASYKPTYTVTFKNSNGNTLQTVTVIEGGTATYTGATPVSPDGTAEEGYTFFGWGNPPVQQITNVIADTTVYATYDSPIKDVEITDSWDRIIANIDNGTYKSKYKLGNYKPLDLGTEGTINMQIVGMDVDELPGGGTAPLTFIGKELLATKHRMNSTRTTNGGWAATEMRSYLKNTVKPLIPSNVRSRINAVTKYSMLSDGTEQITTDDVWIPSEPEIKGKISYNHGSEYIKVYDTASSRAKKRIGQSINEQWFLRDSFNSGYSTAVQNDGNFYSYFDPDEPLGVALGFCLGLEQDTITDSWETILANENPSASYSIGDTKYLDIGSYGKHLMQIVAFDTDDLADGSGKAKITWISKNLIATHRMNASATNNNGWTNTEMRSWLRDTVMPQINATVRAEIKEVTKTYYDYTTKSTLSATDNVWIPSVYEIFGAGQSNGCEDSGHAYTTLFKDATSRIKKYNSSAYTWWLRSAYGTNSHRFRYVISDGDLSNNDAYSSLGVALGFSI